jgi:phosphoglycolate phosphatase
VTKKAIFFDCDGTLLDTLRDIHEALNATLSDLGYPQVSLEKTRSYVGNGLRNVLRKALGHDDVDEALALFHVHYSKNLMVYTTPYEGIVELVDELKEQGFILGMISNKTDAYVHRLAHHFFEGKFDVVVGEKEGLARKPHKDMLDFATSATNVTYEEVIFVGDSLVDGEFIRNHNLHGALLTFGFEDKELLLKTGFPCFDHVSELRSWILSSITS